MGESVELEKLAEIPELKRFQTANTFFLLVGVDELWKVQDVIPWFEPQEYSWMEPEYVGGYILGVGIKSGEKVQVNHIFSLAEQSLDRNEIADLLERQHVGNKYYVDVSEVELTIDETPSGGRWLRVTHPGRMLSYNLGQITQGEIYGFFGVK